MYQKTKQDQLLVSLVKNNALRGWLLADEAAWQYVELSVLGVKLTLGPGGGDPLHYWFDKWFDLELICMP